MRISWYSPPSNQSAPDVKLVEKEPSTARPQDINTQELPKREHLAAAYAAVNPNKRIPAMEDDGFILWESNAITQYLASKKPEAGLLPLDGRAHAQVNQWQF